MPIVFADGAEHGANGTIRGWSVTFVPDTVDVHDVGGARGTYSYAQPFNTQTNITFDRDADGNIPRLVEVYGAWTWISRALISNFAIWIWRGGTTTQGQVLVSGGADVTELRAPSTFMKDESAAYPIPANAQRSYVYHYKVDNLTGFARLYIGNNPGITPDLTWTGDTRNGTPTYIDGIGIDQGAANAWCIDDIVVWAPAIEIISPSGAIAVGETITGGTSGATARVSWYVVASGEVFIYDWNGTDFIDGETVTFSGGTTATLNAPDATTYLNGLAPFSTYQKPGLFIQARTPADDGAVQMTPSAGVVNADMINSIPAVNTTYVTAAGGLTETDAYNTFAALAVATDDVLAVSRFSWLQGSAVAYPNMGQTLVDGAGSQSATFTAPAADTWRESYFGAQSDASAWAVNLIPTLTTTVSLVP